VDIGYRAPPRPDRAQWRPSFNVSSRPRLKRQEQLLTRPARSAEDPWVAIVGASMSPCDYCLVQIKASTVIARWPLALPPCSTSSGILKTESMKTVRLHKVALRRHPGRECQPPDRSLYSPGKGRVSAPQAAGQPPHLGPPNDVPRATN